jgi:hypothetical protein
MFVSRLHIILMFCLCSIHASAQKDITGTWEGSLGRDQFLQINIIQNGDKICGFTYDHIKLNRRDYCKAYFDGRFDKKQNRWIIQGTAFIENSGSHTLMKLSLAARFSKRRDVMEGLCINPPPAFSFFFRDEDGSFSLKSNDDSVYLRRVSNKPSQVLPHMEECYQKKYQTFSNNKPADTSVTAKKDSIATVKKDTVAKIIQPPVVKPDTAAKTITKLPQRKNREQSRIEVNVKSITLNVYDNAVIDGDTVSIFYNGKLLLSRQRLSEKPIVINLELDEKQTRHEVTLVAENLGGIPPNTALIVVYAGNKRHELFSSASLEENAVLVFDYVPK